VKRQSFLGLFTLALVLSLAYGLVRWIATSKVRDFTVDQCRLFDNSVVPELKDTEAELSSKGSGPTADGRLGIAFHFQESDAWLAASLDQRRGDGSDEFLVSLDQIPIALSATDASRFHFDRSISIHSADFDVTLTPSKGSDEGSVSMEYDDGKGVALGSFSLKSCLRP